MQNFDHNRSSRSPSISERTSTENNSQVPINSLLHVLTMAPLNSMPYNCPLGDISSYGTKGEGKTEAIERVGTAMIFLPSNSGREDWETLTAASAMIAHVLRLMVLGETVKVMIPIIFVSISLVFQGVKVSYMADRTSDANNTQGPMPLQHVLSVAHLNSRPYIGPTSDTTTTLPTEGETEAVERVGPAMKYFTSNSPREEWEKLTGATKFGIALSGGAATGTVGPVLRLTTLGESEDSSYFRVNLSGVSRDEKYFSCDIQPDGKILIKGVTHNRRKNSLQEWSNL